VNDHKEIVESDVVRRLIWTGLLAAPSTVATVGARRGAAAIWVRVFAEEPPK
jgi:hypothetical protein